LGQCPNPSQIPVVPQLALPLSVQRPWGSVEPGATGEQVPALPAMLQALQLAHDALAQQTWSVHLPLMHSALPAQVDPSGFRLVQIPDWQV
jgi:hypothetical protein